MADTTVIQVTNVSPFATLDLLKTLFGHFGQISNIALYNLGAENIFKVCFVQYRKATSALLAQHLTNTVFIDRILVVLPYKKNSIPSEITTQTELAPTLTEYATNFDVGVVSQVVPGANGVQVISTTNPRLTALNLSQYPHLPLNTEPARIEEIRRTLYVGNLDSTVSPDEAMKFFNDIGEIKYIRLAGDETQATRFAFVEYTHQSSVANALQNSGATLGSRSLKINHSNNAIVKPQPRLEGEDVKSSRSRPERHDSRDRHSSSRHDRERRRDKYDDRRPSPRESRRRRSRSRDSPYSRRRSKSRERTSRRSRSRDRGESHKRNRSRSRDSRSSDRSRSRRHRSSRK